MSAAPLAALARTALERASGDYMARDLVELQRMQQLVAEGRLERILRFDVGSNTDGYSPLAQDVFASGYLAGMLGKSLREYPDTTYELLRKRLALRYGLDPGCFVLAAGLEAMIDHLARALLEPGSPCLVPVPNFSLYEDYSLRQGAVVHRVPMEALGPWSGAFVARLETELELRRPRVLWISTPVNPVGCALPRELLERLVARAARTGTWVVVDEAYGEYVDGDEGPRSCAVLVPTHPNLAVLRTFSKIYGLPSLRVGLLMSSDETLRRAVQHFRPTFPFSWFSLYTCQLALLDDDWLAEARSRLARRRPPVEAGLDALAGFQRVPTDVNTLLFRHRDLAALDLQTRLADRGALVANVDAVAGMEGQGWLRMTIREEADNAAFLEACAGAAQG